ncbi:hypothetical protein ACO0SA_003023 [Hanseniaspora valbyensis]
MNEVPFSEDIFNINNDGNNISKTASQLNINNSINHENLELKLENILLTSYIKNENKIYGSFVYSSFNVIVTIHTDNIKLWKLEDQKIVNVKVYYKINQFSIYDFKFQKIIENGNTSTRVLIIAVAPYSLLKIFQLTLSTELPTIIFQQNLLLEHEIIHLEIFPAFEKFNSVSYFIVETTENSQFFTIDMSYIRNISQYSSDEEAINDVERLNISSEHVDVPLPSFYNINNSNNNNSIESQKSNHKNNFILSEYEIKMGDYYYNLKNLFNDSNSQSFFLSFLQKKFEIESDYTNCCLVHYKPCMVALMIYNSFSINDILPRFFNLTCIKDLEKIIFYPSSEETFLNVLINTSCKIRHGIIENNELYLKEHDFHVETKQNNFKIYLNIIKPALIYKFIPMDINDFYLIKGNMPLKNENLDYKRHKLITSSKKNFNYITYQLKNKCVYDDHDEKFIVTNFIGGDPSKKTAYYQYNNSSNGLLFIEYSKTQDCGLSIKKMFLNKYNDLQQTTLVKIKDTFGDKQESFNIKFFKDLIYTDYISGVICYKKNDKKNVLQFFEINDEKLKNKCIVEIDDTIIGENEKALYDYKRKLKEKHGIDFIFINRKNIVDEVEASNKKNSKTFLKIFIPDSFNPDFKIVWILSDFNLQILVRFINGKNLVLFASVNNNFFIETEKWKNYKRWSISTDGTILTFIDDDILYQYFVNSINLLAAEYSFLKIESSKHSIFDESEEQTIFFTRNSEPIALDIEVVNEKTFEILNLIILNEESAIEFSNPLEEKELINNDTISNNSSNNNLSLDKKRKKIELDINRNNTPSPVEMKKMKTAALEEFGNNEFYKLLNNPHLSRLISFDDAYKHYLDNLDIDIPDCHNLFPWLHDFENNESKSGDLLIENSGILKGSLNSRSFFKDMTETIRLELKEVITQEINFYNNTMLSLGLTDWTICEVDDLNLIYNICNNLNIIPILKNDSIKVEKESYGENIFQQKQQNSVDPSFYRRFDIQTCKMLLLSKKILLYCYHDDDKECDYCNGLKLIFQFSYYNIVTNYGVFGNIHDIEVFKKLIIDISIIDMTDIDNNHPFIGTPLLTVSALEKPENQLVSKFDSYIINNWEKDLFYREKLEISKISSNSTIDDDIWIGSSIDYEVSKMGIVLNLKHKDYFSIDNSICGIDHLDVDAVNDLYLFNFPESIWDVFVHCKPVSGTDNRTLGLGNLTLHLIKQIFQVVDLMYQLSKKYQRKILIYSQDGYSESSFLLLAYIIYSQNLSLKEAITYAHINLKRPFFIFPNDLEVLNYLQILLLAKSSEKNIFLKGEDMKLERFEVTNEDFTNMFFNQSLLATSKTELDCMINLKGPLPSQILEYLYLGSLKHANNLNLLKDLKINCVISVGEKLSWLNEHDFSVEKIESNNVDIYKSENMTVYHIDNLLDNGHDPLFHSLNDILKFIDEHRKSNSDSKILVHCMVGVSRSATVVIAEVMKELKLSLVRAYLYVRVRRLNIIIQPNLLFMYELLKYEEFLSNDLKIKLMGVPEGCKRSVDWACLSKSIDELNENYLK